MSITQNKLRIGNFTSSEIYKLVSKNKAGEYGKGAPAMTYIAEKNLERMLGCSLGGGSETQAMSWGKFMEQRVHELLPIKYKWHSDVSIAHPTIPYWTGSPDGVNTGENEAVAVIDYKCPFSKGEFMKLVHPLYLGFNGADTMDMIRNGYEHNGVNYKGSDSADKYYWQLVSNACLLGLDYAELIIFAPKNSEDELYNFGKRVMAEDLERQYKWLQYTDESKLPFIPANGKVNDINIIRFAIPQSDKDLLTECVINSGKLLINI